MVATRGTSAKKVRTRRKPVDPVADALAASVGRHVATGLPMGAAAVLAVTPPAKGSRGTVVVLGSLKKRGFLMPNRDQERLMLYCKTVCIYYAICKVFFTEEHFKKGEAFKYTQILECRQYMYVTREQFWFALSHLFPTTPSPTA